MSTNTPVSPRTRLNTATLGVAALVLIGMVGLSYHEWREYSRANADAAETREIWDSLDTLLSSLTDAETGQRGFLLTGNSSYLQPYNQAVEVIPGRLSHLNAMLAERQGESINAARLNRLVNQKLNELRQTIELRRTQGAESAVALVLSDHDQRAMDEIRALGAEIQRRENSAQSQASTKGEVAAQSALLVTVLGSLVLLFLFAFGLEPFAASHSRSTETWWILRYGAAVLSVAAAFLLRSALVPLIGGTELAFTIFLPAILFAAWFGGFRVGVLSTALSALAADYYYLDPVRSFLLRNRADQITLLVFVVLGLGIALLAHSQRQAVERATTAENNERSERQRFETTLASIGDGVIATNKEGLVTFVNKVAQSLLKAPEAALLGRHLDDVFQIVNELTRAKVESPIAKVLREGGVVGLANHTVLIAQDGTEIPIDDSGAALRTEGGPVLGTVLVFRNITERRDAEEARRQSELSAELVRVQDEERRRIGRELHDSAGQNLVMLKINLDLLALESNPDETMHRKLAECIHLADQLIGEVRTTSYALYPPTLEDVGLKSAIQSYLDGFRERSGIVTKVEIPPDFARPPRDLELAIFRVLQESLTNILRHSGSPVANIRLDIKDGTVRLEVADQGKGIPPEVLDAFNCGSLGTPGVGLRGMKERIRQLGGNLSVSSTAGGTIVSAAVALGTTA